MHSTLNTVTISVEPLVTTVSTVNQSFRR